MTEKVCLELKHAIGFNGSIPSSLFFHPNGEEYVYISGGNIVLSSLNDAHNQHFLKGHDDKITCLAISKTGSMIASGQTGKNADVCVWNLEKKQLLFRLNEHDHGVSFVAFSEDEKLLLTIGDQVDKRLLIWDTSNGNIVTSTALIPANQTVAAWGGHVKDVKRRTTSNYQLATASNNKIFIWNLNPHTGGITKVLVNTGSFVRDYTCLCFSKEGDFLYAGSTSGDISCISVRSYMLQTNFNVCTSGVRSICFMLSSDKVIIGGGDSTVSIYSGTGKNWAEEKRIKLNEGGAVTSVSLDGQEEKIMTGTTNCDIYVVQYPALNSVLLSRSHRESVLDVCYRPEETQKFATASRDGSIRYWNAVNYSVITEANFKGDSLPLCICFVYDVIIAGFSDGSIKSVDSATGKNLWEINQAHRKQVTAIASSHNEKFFISGDLDGEVRVWDTKNRSLLKAFKEHRSTVTSLLIFSDDSYFLSGSKDRSILCWDVKKQRRISEKTLRIGGINSFILCPDSNTIISVGTDKQLTFWGIRQCEPMRTIEYSNGKIFEPTAIALSNNGKYFAVGGKDDKVNLYLTQTADKIATGRGHSGTINKIVFSLDDQQIITVGEDGCVIVWDLLLK